MRARRWSCSASNCRSTTARNTARRFVRCIGTRPAKFNVPLVPFLLDGVAQDPKLMQDDGMHPLAAGEPKVFENVWPTIATAVGTK